MIQCHVENLNNIIYITIMDLKTCEVLEEMKLNNNYLIPLKTIIDNISRSYNEKVMNTYLNYK